ncbi:MAG TPA: L-threonylcarbamoyladenylate synthase [Armatimonadota bacterium]|nr:L-threonylcarbamoyladenylate synthase [Armatimonadota bacterium]
MMNLPTKQQSAPVSIPIWNARAGRMSDQDLSACVAVLRRGGVVAIPTETVYGLAVNALDEAALGALCECKGRDVSKGFAAQANSGEELKPLVAPGSPGLIWDLLSRFAPGPLTVVTNAAPGLPSLLLGRGRSIALRVPDHPVALAILKAFSGPLAVTSANRSGERPANTLPAAIAAAPGIDAGVDAGPSRFGQPSTVVDLRVEPPEIVREGAIPSSLIVNFIKANTKEQP